jgi:hypothetical protein
MGAPGEGRILDYRIIPLFNTVKPKIMFCIMEINQKGRDRSQTGEGFSSVPGIGDF